METQRPPMRSVVLLNRRKFQLLRVLPILILLVLGLRWGSLLLMGIALSLLILMILTVLPGGSPKSWLDYILNLAILLYLSLLLLSLVLDLEWKPRAARLQIYQIPDASSPLVELYLPPLILTGDEPVSGSMRLRPEASGPVTVTIGLPSALRFADMPDQPERWIHLFPQAPQTGFRFQGLPMVPGLWGTVSIEAIVEDTSGRSYHAELPLRVEGWMASALRQALDRWRGEVSSFIGLLISVLAELGSLALQTFRKRMEREAYLRKEGQRLIGELRQRLRDGDIRMTWQVLSQIRALEQNAYVPEDVIRRTEEILRALEAPEPPADLEDMVRKAPWPEAAARVFLRFARGLPEPQRRLLRQEIPLDALPDRLRDEMEQLPSPLPPQPRRWPPADLIPPAPPGHSEVSPFIKSRLGGQDPFPPERAEEELQRLLDPRRSIFWPHPLWEHLVQIRQPVWVEGPPGSGRTAMAIAMAGLLHPRLQNSLILYLPAWIGPEGIPRGFARLLLRFIRGHPTWLASLDRPPQRLLSRFLKSALGAEVVEESLHHALLHLEEAPWLKEAKDKDQQAIWLQEARYGLRRLLQEGSGVHVPALSETWTDELLSCAQALEFHQVRVIIDLSGSTADDTTLRALIDFLPRWGIAGIPSTVFLPVGRSPLDQERYEIRWEDGMLKQLMDHRYRTILGSHRALAEIIDPEALERLIQAARSDPQEGAPRRLGRLWRRIAESLPAEHPRVTVKDIEKAMNRNA